MPTPHTEGLTIVTVGSQDASRLLLRLEGELDLATAPALRVRLREFDDQPLMLDVSGLVFTDSTGLAVLLEEWTRALQDGTALRICGATGQTRDLLERTGVLELFNSPSD